MEGNSRGEKMREVRRREEDLFRLRVLDANMTS
jgi:hypothetical protein